MSCRIRPPLALLAFASFCLPATAQQASFTTFGSGCTGSGSGGQVCKSANGSATQLQSLGFARTSEVSIEVAGGIGTPLVAGFEILTSVPSFRSKQTFNAHIYFADAKGGPLTPPAATGSMTVDKALAWYGVTFPKPLLVKPGQKFFLSWTDKYVPFSQTILWPVPTTGTKGVTYHREANSGPWRGPFTLYPWAWRVLCPGGAVVPVLSNTGLPKLGQSYAVDLSKAKPTTGAVLILGLSNTSWGPVKLPLSLKGLGAATCSLLVSYDVPTALATSSGGTASLKIPVPKDSNLAGVKLHHQWMVVDSGANPAGLAFSRGGTATLGN